MIGGGVGTTAVIGVVVVLIIKAITGTVGAVTANAGASSAVAPKPKPAGPKMAWNFSHNTGYGKTSLNKVSRSSINPDLLQI